MLVYGYVPEDIMTHKSWLLIPYQLLYEVERNYNYENYIAISRNDESLTKRHYGCHLWALIEKFKLIRYLQNRDDV